MKALNISLAAALLLSSFALSFTGPGPSKASSPVLERTRAEGISFLNVSDQAGLAGVRGDSFAWGDYDNDGHQDLLVKGSRLFRNLGPPDYGFQEVTFDVGLDNSGYSVWGDLNNDGYLDIFSVGHPYNWWDTVWLNDGPPGFRFRNASSLSGPHGVDDRRPGLAVGLGDIDRDGDLDAYVVNWRDDADVKYADVLWRNDGGGRFTDVTEEAGIVDWNENRGEPNAGMGVNMGDYNNDGWIDIYVSNYLITPNYLWENQKDGTFIDVALSKGCAGEPTVTPQDTFYGHSAGSQWCDYDNDGDLDMWTSNLAHKDPYRTWICDDSELWRNDGEAAGFSFTNVRDQTGIPTVRLETEELFFGIAWGDYDNDGDMDMWLPCVKSYLDYAYSYLFENQGDGTFVDVSEEVGMRIWDSDGGAWCDYDEDGDLDLITEGKYPYENGTYETHLFRNEGTPKGGYLQVDLRSSSTGPSPIGARVYVWDPVTGELLGLGEVEGGTAGHSYVPSFTQEFGLGGRDSPIDVMVRWPEGNEELFAELEPDQRVMLVEGGGPDLSLGKMSVQAAVDEGDPLVLKCQVSNDGDSDVRNITMTLEDDHPEGGGWDRTVIIGLLKASAVSQVDLELPTTGRTGRHLISLSIVSSSPPDKDPADHISTAVVDVIGANAPPEIASFSADPDTVPPGGSTVLTVDAADTDGDVLYFEFSCPTGEFVPGDPTEGTVEWIASGLPAGTDDMLVGIDVTVSDGGGGSDSSSLSVRIGTIEAPPVIVSRSISRSSVRSGDDEGVRIIVQVVDEEGPDAVDSVTADLSELGAAMAEPLNDNGNRGDLVPDDSNYSLTFYVPPEVGPGERTITITAQDRDGMTSSVVLRLTVTASEEEVTDRGSTGPSPDAFLCLGAAFVLALIAIFASARVVRGIRHRKRRRENG